jgi:hypothetical protein
MDRSMTRRRCSLFGLSLLQTMVFCFTLYMPNLYCADDSVQKAAPADATQGIIRAFDTHAVVMFGEVHANKQEYEFLRSLVASPQFADEVDDIVVEYGNSLYQNAVDRYIAGEDVPFEEVQKAWRNTMALGPVSPAYASLYETVRQVNQRRRGKHQMRILLGDPYINWDHVKSREDVGPYLAHRDEFYASVVNKEVLAKHHRAFLIAGWPHFARPPLGPGYIEKELRSAGASTFVVVFGTNAVGGYDDLDKRFEAWKIQALVPLKGTWVGDLPALPVLSGGTMPVGPNPAKLQDAADAMLYLGPRDTLTVVPIARADYEGTPYEREMNRRLEILFGKPTSMFAAGAETQQFPRSSGGPPPSLPPPPKSINDPLPPRPD